MRALSMSVTRAGDLGDPQPGGIGGHDDRAVLEVSDGGEEASQLVAAKDDREGAWLLDGRAADGGVVAAQSLAIEKSQGAAGRIIVAVRDVLLLKEVE